MADGELRLTLDDEEMRRVQAAADAAGLPVEVYARRALVGGLRADRWAESRRRIAEYQRTGESITIEEALAHFDRELDARRAKLR
jgi:hypothetical protein